MRRQSQPWTWLVVAIAGWIQSDQQAAIVCVFGHDGCEELVAETLVVPFCVIVHYVFRLSLSAGVAH